jgi:threo-3-hydroxy-L-aspartate ammonia-lyase
MSLAIYHDSFSKRSAFLLVERAMERIGQPPDMSLVEAVTLSHVRDAATRLVGRAVRTPTLRSFDLEAKTGASRVWLKCENLQRINAFKFRGAYNALCQLTSTGGVLTYSSGNHAQAVALAASLLGLRAVVVMPSDAPRVKLERTKELLKSAGAGSRVVEYQPGVVVREELGQSIAKEEGLEVVPPYDDPRVIAGQGTVALELIEDACEPVDMLLVCCGGGGLLSGCAVVTKSVEPQCRVIGVEPALADDATRSFRSGVLHTVKSSATIADGARTPYLGRYTFPLVMSFVDDMMTVSEDELVHATRYAANELKLVAEPSGVLALAALLQMAGTQAVADKRVGVVISGGNVDPAALTEMLHPPTSSSMGV